MLQFRKEDSQSDKSVLSELVWRYSLDTEGNWPYECSECIFLMKKGHDFGVIIYDVTVDVMVLLTSSTSESANDLPSLG